MNGRKSNRDGEVDARERGSALVIAILITVILALLGISFRSLRYRLEKLGIEVTRVRDGDGDPGD